ncbi:MAG: hypothetical protein AAF224_04880 [Pseudomonadota bacterium]
MADNAASRSITPGALDATGSDSDENKNTYETFIRAYSEIGVPFAIALTMFFTNLVMANGVIVAVLAAVVTYLFVFFVVKAFFSH